jgi:hypothetical protein
VAGMGAWGRETGQHDAGGWPSRATKKRNEPVIFHLQVALVGNVPPTPGILDLVGYSVKIMELGPAPPFF